MSKRDKVRCLFLHEVISSGIQNITFLIIQIIDENASLLSLIIPDAHADLSVMLLLLISIICELPDWFMCLLLIFLISYLDYNSITNISLYSFMKIFLATKNPGKISEFRQILSGLNVDLLSYNDIDIPDVEETGTTFVENAILKAKSAARATNLPSIADDSGIEVDYLNGRPEYGQRDMLV